MFIYEYSSWLVLHDFPILIIFSNNCLRLYLPSLCLIVFYLQFLLSSFTLTICFLFSLILFVGSLVKCLSCLFSFYSALSLFLSFAMCLRQQLHFYQVPPPAEQAPLVPACVQWPQQPCDHPAKLIPFVSSIRVVVTSSCSWPLGCFFTVYYCQCATISHY